LIWRRGELSGSSPFINFSHKEIAMINSIKLKLSKEETKLYKLISDKAEKLGVKNDLSGTQSFDKWLNLTFMNIQNDIISRLQDLKLCGNHHFPHTIKSVIGNRTIPEALDEIIADIQNSNITINGVDSRWNSFLDEFILGNYHLDQYSLFASYFFIYKYKKGL
jgi:hypothetical protein